MRLFLLLLHYILKASIGRFTLGLVSSYDTEHRLHATLAKHIFKASAGEVVILTLWDCRSDQHQYVTGSKINFLAERSFKSISKFTFCYFILLLHYIYLITLDYMLHQSQKLIFILSAIISKQK